MITLYQFPPSFGLPVSVSPYCAKLELYFRMMCHQYETAIADVRKSPNKQVPYVRWDDGAIQADSGDIVAKLEAKGPALDEGLSDADRARGDELVALAQDSIYFGCLYARFVAPDGWTHQKPIVKELVPWILSPILIPVIRSSQVKRCRENGFADASGYTKSVAAIEKIAAALGDKPFVLGDEPRVADCDVWANLLQAGATLADSPVRKAVRQDDKLVAYLQRLAKRADLTIPTLS